MAQSESGNWRYVRSRCDNQNLHSERWIRCFRCVGNCVCWACTKGKAAKALKAAPIYVRLSNGKSEVVPSPSRLRPVVELPMSPVPKFGPPTTTGKISRPKKKPVVPQPKWVEVDTDLSKSEAEDRFFVSSSRSAIKRRLILIYYRFASSCFGFLQSWRSAKVILKSWTTSSISGMAP